MADPTTIRMTDRTKQQIEALQEMGFGTMASIIRLAVDRMYSMETRREALKGNPPKGFDIVEYLNQ